MWAILTLYTANNAKKAYHVRVELNFMPILAVKKEALTTSFFLFILSLSL